MASNDQEISAPKPSDSSFSEADEWRECLAAIAEDIQRGLSVDLESSRSKDHNKSKGKNRKFMQCAKKRKFYSKATTLTSTSTIRKTNEGDENTLLYLQSLLNEKREQIKRLDANVKTACLIAKTVIAAKENESASLTDRLNEAKNQAAIMSERNRENELKFKNLYKEYQTLNDEMEKLSSFIALAYERLQKIRKESCENLSLLEKLKKIIECCGQYYADYSNEHENCQQLEQKNRFLNSKIRFLESTIISKMEELKKRQHQNIRLVKENNTLRNSRTKKESHAPIVMFTQSDHQLTQNAINPLARRTRKLTELTLYEEFDEYSCDTSLRKLDLNNHLRLVQNLLRDQDCVITELRNISQELNSHSLEN